MTPKNQITADELREMLDYNPETGVFRHRPSRRGYVKPGSTVGSLGSHGYLQIKINARLYLSHRLAWLYTTGEWPADQIDHVNGIRTDNRIANLRKATNAENRQNQRRRSRNASGHSGVSWHIRAGKWMAHINVGGKRFHLGYFDDITDAVAARADGKARYHEFQGFDR